MSYITSNFKFAANLLANIVKLPDRQVYVAIEYTQFVVFYFLVGPKPIKLLQITEIDINFVTLQWGVYNGSIPDYYLISYRNNDNGVVTYEPDVDSNKRTYKIQNLVGNTPYTISMMAVKGNINSSVVLKEFRTILSELLNLFFSFFSITRDE